MFYDKQIHFYINSQHGWILTHFAEYVSEAARHFFYSPIFERFFMGGVYGDSGLKQVKKSWTMHSIFRGRN